MGDIELKEIVVERGHDTTNNSNHTHRHKHKHRHRHNHKHSNTGRQVRAESERERKDVNEGEEVVTVCPKRLEHSLVPADLWNSCCAAFVDLRKKGEDMIYLHKAKRQWAQDNAGASQFEIALFASMVESHSVTVSNANSYEGVTETMLDHVGFALGSFLISKERPELPKECTVQQYIDSGFQGARTLAKLCNEKASTPLVIRFVVLFVVNLVLSVGTVVYWASSIGGLVTVGIGIYLHWFYCSVLFAWKTPYLTASAMVFGIYGGMFSVVGFSFALTCNDSLFWYRYWYGWGLWQFVYMVLSSIFLGHTCRLFCGITPSSTVPVPQFRVMTSHSVVAWILIGIYVPIFIVLIIVGLVLFNWHAVQVVGFTVLCCLFVLPALFIFIVMAAQVFPKRVSIPGLIVSLVLVLSSGVAAVGFGLTGEWNVVVTTS